jgi:hypothetical protein
MKNTTILLDLPFAPSIPWCYLYLAHERIWLEKQEHFVKSTFRNRCEIAGPQGVLTLSIPVEGGKDHRRLYRETLMVQDSRWRKVHFQSLASCYRRTPYFEYFESDIQQLYNHPVNHLFDWNVVWLDWILAKMGITPRHTFTSVYEANPSRAFDARLAVRPGRRDEDFFKDYVSPVYLQAFSSRVGFLPNLSVLDFLFHEGPRAHSLIEQWNYQSAPGADD